MDMPETYSVRRGAAGDYDRLGAVFDQAEVFHRRALPHIFCEPDGTFPPRDMYVALAEGRESCVFVAEMGTELIGFVLARAEHAPDDPLLARRRFVTVDMLAVQTDRQRNGIGRALMDVAHAWAAELGVPEVQLNVWEFNQRAIAFYETLGYRTLSRLMERPVPKPEPPQHVRTMAWGCPE